MRIAVKCRCPQPRTIDTDKVGPYRLRCTTCREIIYDPAQVATPVEPEPAESDSQFQRWLEGSAELKVLSSAEHEVSKQMCAEHPKLKVVAGCNKCGRLLCRSCLDRVGDTFTCSSCIAKTLADRDAAPGVRGFFARLFGRR